MDVLDDCFVLRRGGSRVGFVSRQGHPRSASSGVTGAMSRNGGSRAGSVRGRGGRGQSSGVFVVV